ncbi:MAG: gliding motility-associated C-terminal domain-containing protein [Bacteroidales bacterium]|nr:gliding motility-associated C-terminal domain-containing protein [Bacteroidales bacterium]
MKKTLLLVISTIIFATNSFGQSCPNSTVRDITNNIDCSGDTIQLTCDMPFVTLAPKVFAPGASNNYIVESIPYNPPCPFTISPTAVDYVLPADDVWGMLMGLNFGLPAGSPVFEFSFYGQNDLDFCVIGSNGLLSWDPSVASGNDFMTIPSQRNSCAWSLPDTPIPNPNIYKNCIFGPYHDIDFNAVGGVGQMYFQIIGEYPCRKIVLSFENVPMFSCNNMRAFHMMVLYETTNTIEFYMQNKPLCSSWNGGKAILGIQNATGTQATVVSNYNLPTQWTATNEAWRIRPVGNLEAATEWYRKPASGGARVPVGANDDFEAIANPSSAEGAQWYFMETTIYRLDGTPLTYIDSVLVKPIDLPTFTITHNDNTEKYDTICMGSNVNIQLSGGSTYRLVSPFLQENINPNSFSVIPTVNTTYIFEVDNNDEFGNRICTRVDSFNVQPILFNVEIGNPITICQNDTVTLMNLTNEAIGSSQWSFANNPISSLDTLIFTPQSSGFISYTLTDNHSCFAKDSLYITVDQAPNVSISGTTRICLGTQTSLTANSSLANCTYEWNTGETTESIVVNPTNPETTYEVSVKLQPANCETKAQVTVYALNKPTVNASSDVNICLTESAQIYVTGSADSYYWTTFPVDANIQNNTSTNLTVEPIVSTMYIAHGANDINCQNSDTVLVYVSPLPEAQMTFNPSIIDDLDPTVIMSDITDGSVLRLWTVSDGATSSEEIFVHLFDISDTAQTFNINLYVENAAGCQDSISNIIRIAKTHYLWAPSAVYVYDSDPNNTQFRVYVDNPVEFELKVFNRWGEMVFQTNNPEKAWDCTYKGSLVPQGAYVWMAKYSYADKRKKVFTDTGTVNIYK